MKRKVLPSSRDLIILSREYVDKHTLYNGADKLGFDYEVQAQKEFMEVVKWLKGKGY